MQTVCCFTARGKRTLQPYTKRTQCRPRDFACRAGLGDLYKDVMKNVQNLKVRKGDKEATFAPLDAESEGGVGGVSDDVFGPLAVLLVGFHAEEYSSFQNIMRDMEAEMVPIYCATQATLNTTLQHALDNGLPGFVEPPAGVRRAVILSGMYTAEVLDVVGAYRDAELPEAVFAAAVPKNYQSIVSALVEEVYDDDAAVVRRDTYHMLVSVAARLATCVLYHW